VKISQAHHRDFNVRNQHFGYSLTSARRRQGLPRTELVSQLDHAGYLSAELAKAETALRLGLDLDRRLIAPGDGAPTNDRRGPRRRDLR
jgi:hypothetical protein